MQSPPPASPGPPPPPEPNPGNTAAEEVETPRPADTRRDMRPPPQTLVSRPDSSTQASPDPFLRTRRVRHAAQSTARSDSTPGHHSEPPPQSSRVVPTEPPAAAANPPRQLERPLPTP